MSYKEHEINRNTWSKFAEKIRFHVTKNSRVRASLFAAVIHILKRVSRFEMSGGNYCQNMFKSFRIHSEIPNNKG